ncbi:MAG: DUF952 domain-containing protein [Planctomycetota bacterium]
MTTGSQILYKVVPRELWQQAEAEGTFTGSPIDVEDGFIHLSSAPQVKETVAKHFAGQVDLLIVSVRESALRDLQWEPSRGGALFPHVYGPLPLDCVERVDPLPLGPDGVHQFPSDLGL